MSFDPTIALNHHVALLTLIEAAKEDTAKTTGITLAATKGLGRILVAELARSKETMRANKMWVQDQPIGDRLYRYSLLGKRIEREVSQADLDLHTGMTLQSLEDILIRNNPGR